MNIIIDSFLNNPKSNSKRKTEANDYIKSSKMAWKHAEIKKIMSLRMEKENAQQDIDYVSSLNTWNYYR